MGELDYGGQAVIEGVMMRSQKNLAVAVRSPSGEIILHSEPLMGSIYSNRLWRLPFFRGLALLWDTLSLGTRTLIFSANVALSEEEVEFKGPAVWGILFVSLAFAIGLFFVLPLFLVSLIDRFIASALLSNIVEGVIRLGIFLGYLVAIGFLPDIHRWLAYHGAEHKTINAYEAGVPLEPASIEAYSTMHARCGTSFLLIVLVLSIIIFAIPGRPSFLWRILSRILLLPVIAGISYEFLKFSARHKDNPFLRLLVAPGLALQALTTRQPDQGMLEVAITALKAVLKADADRGN